MYGDYIKYKSTSPKHSAKTYKWEYKTYIKLWQRRFLYFEINFLETCEEQQMWFFGDKVQIRKKPVTAESL